MADPPASSHNEKVERLAEMALSCMCPREWTEKRTVDFG